MSQKIRKCISVIISMSIMAAVLLPFSAYAEGTEFNVTFDYGDGTTVIRTVQSGGTVTDIPEPPEKEVISLTNGHENSGVLIKAVYKQDKTLESVSIENDSVTLAPEQTEYDLPSTEENEKYFLWNSLDVMSPLGTMDKKKAVWTYNGSEFTDTTVIDDNITVTPSYNLPAPEPTAAPAASPASAPTAAPNATPVNTPELTPTGAPTESPTSEPAEQAKGVWDFSIYTGEKEIKDNTDEAFTQDYDGLELHLGVNDSVTTDGLVWTAPGTTTSDSKTVSNNRYIKYTPEKSGTLTLNFSGSIYHTTSKAPRIYVISGSDTSCMSKSNSDNGVSATAKAANTETVLTAELDAGTTYYIWPYYYQNSSCVFTVKSLEFEEYEPEMTTRNIYGSNMLLQRDEPIYIDGKCTPAVAGATVELIKTDETEPVQTKAVRVSGREWNVTLDAVSDYTNTYSLVIKTDGMDDLVYDNIIFGDQYLFSGQSNMWKEVSYYKSLDSADYSQTAVEKHTTDKIRVLYTQGSGDTGTAELQYDARNAKPWSDFGTYSKVSPLPAVVFTTATTLYEETGVPIGVIANAYPGSYISSWFDSALAIDACNLGKNKTSNERNWYCGRIYPLRNLELSGVFWYQGEADAAITYHGAANGGKDANGDTVYSYYKRMMGNLIDSWRDLFEIDDLPFYYVQLCRLDRTTDENNADTGSQPETPVKLAQTDTYLEMKDKTNVGIVGTLDIFGKYQYAEGNSKSGNCRTDIHPTQKSLVGKRLAAYALKDIYNKTQYKDDTTVYTTGPIFKSAEIDEDSVVVTFDTNGQLKIMDKAQYADSETDAKIEAGTIKTNELNEFEIKDAEGWHTAKAAIKGTNQVIVSADGVTEPTGVRYAYSDYPDAPNLTDESNLPSYIFMKEGLKGGTDEPADDLTEEESEPTAINTYKFDFIADGETADADAYPVTKTSEYNSTIAEDGLQYGLYGANLDDYKLNNYVDGVTTTKGQLSVYLDGEDCIGPYKVTGEEEIGDDGYGQIAGLYPIRFSMAGTNGGYYRVKVTLKGLDKTKAADATLYSERRHPIIMNETIPAGESKEVEFTATLQNVAIKNRTSGGTDTYKDDKVNVVAVGENIAIDKIEISEIEHQPTIFMYDDSTGCDYAMILPYFNLQNYGGTGQFISKYLRKSYAVANQGDGGINATDNTHWNAAKASISEGDYVYVQYGHNHKNDGAQGYVKSLNKYYDYAHDAGAYTILAGPIDRHNSTQYDKATNTWSSTLGSFSKAAEYFTKLMILRGPDTVAEFVTKVTASSSKSIDADIYEWADGEIAKGLDEGNGRSDIAFVDLNAPTLSWLSEVCDIVKTQRGLDTYSAAYTDYYFLSKKGTKVDGTHPNDAGADNTAKFFFDGAKDIVTKKDKDASETVMAEVLKPLVTNMRTAEPMQVSADIVAQGSAPNSAWPELYKSSNAAKYPTDIKEITWKENGAIDTVSILKQESTTYMSAYGILELIIKDKDGAVKGTIYSTQVDNTWDDGSLTNFSTAEETNKLTGDTNTEYNEETGDTFTAIVWQATDDGSGLGIYKDEENNPVPYSEYYKLSDGSGPLLTNEDGESPENFNFYGAIYTEGNASNLHGCNGWIVNGSSAKNTTLGKDGSRYYANLEKQTKSKSFFVYKKLDSEIAAAGKISFSMDMQYISGSGMYIGVANSFNSKGSPWYNNQLTLLTFDSNSTDSTGNTANVKATDGSSNKTVGTISKNSWTTVSGTLDMDNGKMTVKVEDGTETETTISNYDTISTVITPSTLAAFFIKGADKELVGIRISNVAVTKLADTDLPNKTLTISSSDAESGTVSIDGTESLTLTSVQNSEAAITATAKTANDKFLGWYEGETLISEEETLTLRLHRDLTLVAKFKNLSSVTIASAVNNADYGSVTLNGSADASLDVSEDETVTLRAISKTGYKFVNWTKDGSEVAKTPSYTITASSSNETYTANFTALGTGETVWEFTDIADNEAVTTTTETAQKTYGAFEIHLGSGGDSVSADGLYWKGPGSTKSDTTLVTNNRYIKYTADAAGTLNINFSSTYMAGANSNNNPRIYIVTSEANLSKSGGDSENTAGTGKSYTLKKSNSVETISISTTAGTTYYIFPYCYGKSEAPFAISSIAFEKTTE